MNITTTSNGLRPAADLRSFSCTGSSNSRNSKTVSATDEEPASASPARYLWAMRLARLFESLPLVCPCCGANMRIIAFITETAPVEQILTHIGEPPRPAPISPARGPPAWDGAPEPAPDWDLAAPPEPEVEFDQPITW